MEGERIIVKTSCENIPSYNREYPSSQCITFSISCNKLNDIEKMILEWEDGIPEVELSYVQILVNSTIYETIYPYCMEHMQCDGKYYAIIDNIVYHMNVGIMCENIQMRVYYKGDLKDAHVWISGSYHEGTSEDTAHYGLGTVHRCNLISLTEKDIKSCRIGGMLSSLTGTMMGLHVKLVDADRHEIPIKSISVLKDGLTIFPEKIPSYLLGYLQNNLRLNRTDIDLGGKYMDGTWVIRCEIDKNEICKDHRLTGWMLQVWADQLIEIETIDGNTEISYK